MTGPQLRLRRKTLNLSLTEIASALGISAPYLWDMEHGYRPMSDAYRQAYGRALARLAKKVKA